MLYTHAQSIIAWCCWAFSTVAAVEGITQIKNGQLISLSEQQLLDYDQNNRGCDGGFMPTTFEYIMQNTLLTESHHPYEEQKGTCRVTSSQLAVTITSYETAPVNDEVVLLNAVTNQPVSVAIDVAEQDFKFHQGDLVSSGIQCGDELQ